jgi:hypothetical protein
MSNCSVNSFYSVPPVSYHWQRVYLSERIKERNEGRDEAIIAVLAWGWPLLTIPRRKDFFFGRLFISVQVFMAESINVEWETVLFKMSLTTLQKFCLYETAYK